MPKNKKEVDADDTSSLSSDDAVASPPKSKKTKTEPKKKEDSGSKGKKNSDGETQFDIGNKKFVTVRQFKGKTYVDIREFYEANGEMRPGKKGISLNTEQWEAVKNIVPEIDNAVDSM